MLHLKRIGQTYYVRLIVPRDRWVDVGRATGATPGEKREVVRTLQTRDLKEAHKRRGRALEAIRAALNAKLVSAGRRPLDDGWTPSWEAEALSAREELRRASGRGVGMSGVVSGDRGTIPSGSYCSHRTSPLRRRPAENRHFPPEAAP